ALFRLVAILTGSKNALKGVGFFLGAALLSWIGYDNALWSMAGAVAITVVVLLIFLDEDIGKSKKKPPLRSILSKSASINRLSAARFFLFGSRDIWFVVALPVFLADELGWSNQGVGGFLAVWVIGYGIVQSFAPRVLGRGGAQVDEVKAAQHWALILLGVTVLIAVAAGIDVATTAAVVGGLIVFGVVFAMNSSLHSYLILAYADDDDVAIDVGFYYSANAAGRLVGTLLSGMLYLWGGLDLALWGSAAFVALTWLLTLRLPALPENVSVSLASIEGGD
nr:MFS transporter [Ilumatobacteraceae bacterium]